VLPWGTSFPSVVAPHSFFTCECEGSQASLDLNLLLHWAALGSTLLVALQQPAEPTLGAVAAHMV